MNLIETERLVRKITDLLQNRPQEAQAARVLAEAYAELCQSANHRLRQCAAMLTQGDEHQALQLAEAPPPVLELASRLAFRESEDWRQFCYKQELPVPEPLEGSAIRQLNAAYGKGISPDHALYRDYREAVLLHRDDVAVKALRSITWRNPADTNAPKELERLERKILREKLDQLGKSIAARDDVGAVRWVEEIESLDFELRPGGEIWQAAQAARARLLLHAAEACRASGRWHEAAAHLAQLRALASEHQLQFSEETQADLEHLEGWVSQRHKEQSEQQRFVRSLNELRQMLVQYEEEQVAGNLPNRSELRERLETCRHKWRELELMEQPIDHELETRAHKLLQLFEARLKRLEARRRGMVLGAAMGFVLAAMVLSVTFWNRQRTREESFELNSLRENRQVNAVAQRLAQILAKHSARSDTFPLKTAILSAEEFVRNEQQLEAEAKVRLSQIQTLANEGFEGLPPEQIQARFDETQQRIEATAKDYQTPLRNRFLVLRTGWESWLDSQRKSRTREFLELLNEVNHLATGELRFERGPEKVRVSLEKLRPKLETLQNIASPPPSLSRLRPPSDALAQYQALSQRIQVFTSEMTKWDKIQETWGNPTTLEAYLGSLRLLNHAEFADPSQARAAGDVLALNLSDPALISALLLPYPQQNYAQITNLSGLRLQPEDVMPGERSRLRDLRDDENIHNLHVYRKTLRHAPDSDPNRIHQVYLKGTWDNTRSTLRRGLIFDPQDSTNALSFRRQEFYSEVEFEDLGRAPEADVFEAIGIRQFLESSATNYGGPLLGLLDKINRESRGSPLFRAWLFCRLGEMMDLRPDDWGSHWSPALAADRQRLKNLGAEAVHSGDWLIPSRQQPLATTLEQHFAEARRVSYLEQARFLYELSRRARESGFALVGHAERGDKAVLPVAITEGAQLWGWTAEKHVPGLLFINRQQEPGPRAENHAMPLSPLWVFRGETRQLLAAVKQSFGVMATQVGSWLPPLFATHE